MAQSMTRELRPPGEKAGSGRRRAQGAAAPRGAGAGGVAAGRAELPETLGLMLGRPLAFTGTETQILTCWGPAPRFYRDQNRSPDVLGPAPHFYRDQNRSPDLLGPAPRFYQDPNRSSDVLGAGLTFYPDSNRSSDVLGSHWARIVAESESRKREAS